MNDPTFTPDRPTGVAILGSTGSIGRQTLDVIEAFPDRFRVIALAARTRSQVFLDQVQRYRPIIAAVTEQDGPALPGSSRTLFGMDGLTAAVTSDDVEIVVVATSGHAAIVPTMRAIASGKTIALANKETLVCAGELIMPLAAQHQVEIRPIDSEHSAIWQAIGSTPTREVSRIIVTASGGPFRTTPARELELVTVREALAHPTWSMGDKITIDSATLMNKGLEVMEAHWLFGLPYDRIEVLVHPESIIHSLVEFVDGSQIGQLGLPDMRVPIQYALAFPDRLPRGEKRLELAEIAALHFERPDHHRFPCLQLAREAGIAGQTYPTVLSAADDEAVAAFVQGAIRFTDIPSVLEIALDRHVPCASLTLDAILDADDWARGSTREAIQTVRRNR